MWVPQVLVRVTSPVAVGDSLANVGLVLLVGQRACGLAHGVEVVGADVGPAEGVDGLGDAVVGGGPVGDEGHDSHLIVEVVELDNRLEEDVEDVWLSPSRTHYSDGVLYSNTLYCSACQE